MKKIFIIGDSISIHYHDDIKIFLKGYADVSRKGEGESEGDLDACSKINGGDSRCVLEYLKLCPELKPDIFLINCGLHDIKYYKEIGHLQIEADEYRQNLKNMIQEIKSRGSEMMWIMSTPVDDEIHKKHCDVFFRANKDITAYNEIAKKVMLSENVPMIDLYDFTDKLCGDIFCDHVHFYPEVRKLHAAFIAGQVIAQFGLKQDEIS